MIGFVGWGVIFAVGIAWEVLGLARPRDAWPTLSDLLNLVTRPLLGRWILFGLWLWFGWHLFIRGWELFLRASPVPPDDDSAGTTRAALSGGTALPSLDQLLREDAIPLAVLYALVIAMLLYGFLQTRRARDQAVPGNAGPTPASRSRRRPEPPAGRARRGSPRRWLGHTALTATGGYALFLAGTGLHYGLVEAESAEFMRAAAGGGAFLLCIAIPSFALLSWIEGRAGTARRRRG